ELIRPNAEIFGAGTNTILLRGQAAHGQKNKGVKFEARLRALTEKGSILCLNNRLRVQDANTVTFIVSCVTDYNKAAPSKALTIDLGASCEKALAKANRAVANLQTRSVSAHQQMFQRVSLDLGSSPEKPTDERLEALRRGNPDPALAALYFQFGRYL